MNITICCGNMQAVAIGQNAISSMCTQIGKWAEVVGKAKRLEDLVTPPAGLDDLIADIAGQRIENAYRTMKSKQERGEVIFALKTETLEKVQVHDYEESTLSLAWKRVESSIMRRLVLKEGIRADGRNVDEVRSIWSRAGALPRTHGSALFTRGETQALAVATLGCRDSQQRVDAMTTTVSDGEGQRFYLQYFFPPSSVGETGRVGPPGRREVGHGNLAERALMPVIPDEEEFPYTMRVESTITESNGSSSMASVCGGCLAMLDAGRSFPSHNTDICTLT